MRIRAAIEDDVPQLLGLIRDLTAVDPHNGLSRMTADLLRAQAFRRQPPALCYVVAEAVCGRLTGFLSYWIIGPTADGHAMRILAMFVADTHAGNGPAIASCDAWREQRSSKDA